MAPLPQSPTSCRGFLKVLSVLLLLLVSFLSQVHCYRSEFSGGGYRSSGSVRRMLEVDEDDEDHHPVKIKKTTASSLSSKNQTKILKPSTSSSVSVKNQTKVLKTGSGFGFGSAKNQTKLKLSSSLSLSLKNKTKLLKPTSDSSDSTKVGKVSLKNQFKKLNSTSLKASNSTKTTNKSSDLTKLSSSSSKNKTSNAAQAKEAKSQLEKKPSNAPKSKTQESSETTKQQPKSQSTKKSSSGGGGGSSTIKPYWIDDEQDDLISEFKDMPSKFQQTLLPDLERISRTSKVYLNRANKQITNNFKPIVGTKYAPTVASFISFAFIFIPLILVSLIFNRFKAYFSLQKLLIFIQIYLSIYFSILCLSSLVTGLEPLKFFYATSQSTYVCIQVLQTLAYVLYLLMLLMYLVLVFSTETGPATKMIGLGQTIVGFAVGLHYYMVVFHRAVLRQPPKTSWRVHALYAACFLVICLLTQAERRKKAYLEEGGEEGKKN